MDFIEHVTTGCFRSRVRAFVLAAGMLCVASVSQAGEYLVIDDFNSGKLSNKLGGSTGCWNFNPKDTNQFCKASFDSESRLGAVGAALRLEYSIDTPNTYLAGSPHTGLNGYFTKLNDSDARKYKYIVFFVKGDKKLGFTRSLSVEIKDKHQGSTYVIDGITDSWQCIAIPLAKFKDVNNWAALDELVFNFNEHSTRKRGALWIDNVYFSTDPGPGRMTCGHVPRKTEMEIDGNLSEWKHAKRIHLNAQNSFESGTAGNTEDFNATAATLWDDTYLYCSVIVHDDEISCGETGEDIYKDDCVELFLDPGNDGFVWDNKNDFQIGIAPTGPDGKPQVWAWFQDTDLENRIMVASAVSRNKDNTMYIIEAAIPWELLDASPRPKSDIGFSVAVHDYDPERDNEAKLNWCYIPVEGDILLGRIVLKK